MGIRGLTSFIQRSTFAKPATQVLSPGSFLLVDGSCLAFALLEHGTLLHHDYAAYARTVVEWVRRATDVCGLRVVVFLDGPIRRMKQHTSSKRREQAEAARQALRLYCCDGHLDDDVAELPTPPLCGLEMEAALVDAGIEVVRCAEEADQQLAIACASGQWCSTGASAGSNERATDGHTEQRAQHFVVGQDSDFFAFRDCAYIPLGTLNLNGPDGMATGVVWRRAELAANMGLTESAFVELCILLGNDYTGHFERSLFLGVSEAEDPCEDVLGKHAPVERQLEWMRARERNHAGSSTSTFMLETSDPELALAVAFSRALYDCAPVDEFPVDPKGTASSHHDSTPVAHTSPSSAELDVTPGRAPVQTPQLATQFGRVRRLCSADDIDTSSVHAIVQSFGSAVTANLALSEIESGAGRPVTDLCRQELPAQCAALLRVLRGERVDSAIHGETCLYPKLRWIDSCVAEQWEQLFGSQLRCKMLQSSDATVARLQRPQHWFHGPSFHTFAQEHAQEFQIGQMTEIAGSGATPVAVKEKRTRRTRRSGSKRSPSTSTNLATSQTDHKPGNVDGETGSGSRNPDELPIDAHRDSILSHIASNRVTVITGETGCGKSSRVPQFLLETQPHARLMVAQPRRIAASGLAKRMRSMSGKQFGLRLGHGLRDESESTRCWYVTTGYLLLYLAHHPEEFSRHTHLIIDEVHERSVDTDILCFLARRLLRDNPSIRLILMSATLCSELYRQYFGVSAEPIFVGARRFPVTTHFLDDLVAGSEAHIQSVGGDACKRTVVLDGAKAQNLALACGCEGWGRPRKVLPPGARVSAAQHALAVQIVRQIATDGGAALIFVSGMADIEELTEAFDSLKGALRFIVQPIHSDIPFEEQLVAFDEVEPGTFKIVVATNAAESSVTLPSLDHVICLGTHKQMEYLESSHRQLLQLSWITQSSATQRAGRTGRLRPGNVYRLYPKALYDVLPAFPQSEILRTPLDNTVLRLKSSIDHIAVSEMLSNTLEPPDALSVQRAFSSLHGFDMLTQPCDDGELTATGNLAAALPIDLRLSRMLSVAAQIELLPEAISVCAALTLPKEPFRIASPLIHKDPDVFNAIVAETTAARNRFDGGTYSEPVMLARLLRAWRAAKARGAVRVKQRMKQTMDALAKRGIVTDGNQEELCTAPKRTLGDFMAPTPSSDGDADIGSVSTARNKMGQKQQGSKDGVKGNRMKSTIEADQGLGDARSFARKNALAWSRMQQFDAMERHLRSKVGAHFGVEASDIELRHDISAPKSLNLVRVLLLWAFPDQVVLSKANQGGLLSKRQQKQLGITACGDSDGDVKGEDCNADDDENYFDLDLSSLPPGLSAKHVAGMFPDGVEHEHCQSAEMVHYQASKVSSERVYARVFAVMQRLQVTAAWLVCDEPNSNSGIDGGRGDDSGGARTSRDEKSDKPQRGLHLWLQAREADAILALLNGSSELFVWDQCHELQVGDIHIFEFHTTATKKRLQMMRTSMRADCCRAAFSLKFVPNAAASGLADLDCVGCMPDDVELLALFGDGARWKPGGQMRAKSVLRIRDSATVRRVPLLRDLPLGARTLTLMKQRRGKRVGTHDRAGIAMWAPTAADDAAPSDERQQLCVSLAIPMASWQPIGPLRDAVNAMNIRNNTQYDHHSLFVAALHQEDEDIYAVATTLVFAQSGVRLGGVTALPPGSAWIALAGRLVGMNWQPEPARRASQRTTRVKAAEKKTLHATNDSAETTAFPDCPICLKPMHAPAVTGCGHAFCRQCIEQVVLTLDTWTPPSCPMCRALISSAELRDVACVADLEAVTANLSKANEIASRLAAVAQGDMTASEGLAEQIHTLLEPLVPFEQLPDCAVMHSTETATTLGENLADDQKSAAEANTSISIDSHEQARHRNSLSREMRSRHKEGQGAGWILGAAFMGDASTPKEMDGNAMPVSEPVEPAVSLVPASVRLRRPRLRRHKKVLDDKGDGARPLGSEKDLTAELAAAVPAFAASIPGQILQPAQLAKPQQQQQRGKEAKLSKAQRRRLKKKELARRKLSKQSAALQDQCLPVESADEDEDDDVVLLAAPPRETRNLSGRARPDKAASSGVGPALLTPW